MAASSVDVAGRIERTCALFEFDDTTLLLGATARAELGAKPSKDSAAKANRRFDRRLRDFAFTTGAAKLIAAEHITNFDGLLDSNPHHALFRAC
jgi:hypothetical protein